MAFCRNRLDGFHISPKTTCMFRHTHTSEILITIKMIYLYLLRSSEWIFFSQLPTVSSNFPCREELSFFAVSLICSACQGRSLRRRLIAFLLLNGARVRVQGRLSRDRGLRTFRINNTIHTFVFQSLLWKKLGTVFSWMLSITIYTYMTIYTS